MAAQAPSLWEYTLVVLNEGAPQGEFRLHGSVSAIGRDEDNHVCLSWDQLVSRHHARLRSDGANWILEDLGSTNGTYVGQYRLSDPVVLAPGHTIRIGRTLLQLRAHEIVPPAQPEELPPVESPHPSAAERPVEPAEAVQALEESKPSRPGILSRALSSLGLVGALRRQPYEMAQDTPCEQEPSGPRQEPTGHVSCTIFPLSVEIRARRPSNDGPGVAGDLRAALNGLESGEHAVAKIVEPLHDGDAWVSVTGSSGHEAELLALAGQVIDRLLHAGIHGTLSCRSDD